ncbi:hypothetical protein OR571_04300 [Psychrobacillus sp. NEAU-3TGS]|uniref:hypothetical protein n=1 Tax=Psychrobacillus sp. NEAU-3TGS TaxID=2995412 RepID=UPI0024977343|nr:hypothetical protein [Psychrobacillus sp. NEAU-3TGS]MDI2586371.1 hypothetical protein [Psychrobacillus sp. NEAU-3TGS]
MVKGKRYEGKKPLLYITSGSILFENYIVNKQEEVTDLEKDLPPLKVQVNTTVILFVVDMDAPAFKGGTISEVKPHR